MRANVELAILGAAIVYLAFFSWPVPNVVKDLYHSGVGRAVVLGAIVYLAKYQSIPLAILLAVYYCKACSAAYREAFTEHLTTAQQAAATNARRTGGNVSAAIHAADTPAAATREHLSMTAETNPPPPAVSGNVTTAPPSGGATASPSSSGTTESFMNFSTF